jgi:CAAX protease family protein
VRLRLQGFGALGLLAILVILAGSIAGPVVAAALVLAWAGLAGIPLRALGFVPPRSWPLTLAGGALFGVVLKFAMKAIVMPLLGAPAVNAAYHYLAGNGAALPGIIVTILVSASFGEEVFFRGYLFERLGRLFGTGKAARAGTILLSAVLFALAHYRGQGLPGVEQAAVTGLVLGGIYAWRGEIGIVMVIHAAFDLTAVALIYWDLEEALAHVLFH